MTPPRNAADATLVHARPAGQLWIWLTAPAPEALHLQRPGPEGMLRMVAAGVRKAAGEAYLWRCGLRGSLGLRGHRLMLVFGPVH